MLKAVAVLAVYGLAAPFREPLAAVGLSPLSLAVIFGFLSAYLRDFKEFLETEKFDIDPATLTKALLIMGLGISALVLFAPSDRVIQHGVSILLTLKAALFTGFALWSPQDLGRMRWTARDWNEGQQTAAVWYVLRLLGLMTCYELLILHGSELDWVLAFAVAPVLFYYLMMLGIYVTLPRDDTG